MARTSKAPKIGRNRQSTRQRLWLLMLLTNILGLFGAVMISRQVRSLLLPVAQEPIWMAVGYGLIFVVSVVDAFWADEVFFGGAFRKYTLGGASVARAEKDEDDAAIAASMRPMHLIFPSLLIAAFGLSYFASNSVSRGFYSEYSRVGSQALEVRKKEPADRNKRRRAIAALSMVQRPQIQLFLANQLEHPDEDTAAHAAWALGRLSDKNMRRMLADRLMKSARGERSLLAKEATFALARMQHWGVGPLLEQGLRDALEHTGDDLDPRWVWAMGFVQRASAIPLLSKALYHRDLTVARLAAWALGQQKGRKNADRALKVLKERLLSSPLPLRCAVVHAMGILGHEAANSAIVDAWRQSSPQERQRYCEPLELPLGPENVGNDRHELLRTPVRNTVESYEVMSLFSMGAIRANDPELQRKVLEMLDSILEDESAALRSRDAARSLKAGIQQAK